MSHKHLKINTFNAIHCINKIKDKNHMTIYLNMIDSEKNSIWKIFWKNSKPIELKKFRRRIWKNSISNWKKSEKIQYPFMIKTHHKLGTEGTYLNTIKDIHDKSTAKYFLPFCRLPFHFLVGFLCCTEVFRFGVAPLLHFCFCCLWLWCQIQNIISNTHLNKLTSFIVCWQVYGFRCYIRLSILSWFLCRV